MSSKRNLITASGPALALAVPAVAPAAPQKLVGTVGPGFTIALKTAAGKRVTTLKPGTYSVVITDKSDDHNFSLSGPGLNKQFTGVEFVGTKRVTLRVKAGRYSFVCTPHADEMHGGFTVR